MKVSALGFAALAATAVAGSCQAADSFDYSYVEAGWIYNNVTSVDLHGDGPGVAGSFAFAPRVHVFGAYDDLHFNGGVRGKQTEFGLGYNQSLTSGLDLVLRGAYEKVKAEANGVGSASDSGFGTSITLRGKLSERFELGGGISYVDLRTSGGETTYGVNALYSLSNNFSIGSAFNFNNDGHAVQLGVRYQFNGLSH